MGTTLSMILLANLKVLQVLCPSCWCAPPPWTWRTLRLANKIIDKVVSVDSIFLFQLPETSPEKCRALKKKFKPSSFTSSWVNVAANNVQFSEHLPAAVPGLSEDAMTMLEPVCEASPGSLRSLDHLAGVQHRASLRYVA